MATKRTTKKAETMAAKNAAKAVKAAAPAAEAKAEASKTEAVKAVATETAKAAVETVKAAAETVKETVKATAEVYFQYLGKEFASKDLVSDVKKAWIEMTGKKEEDIQDVKVYVKPEENKAYYVVNGEAEGHYIEL